MKDAKNLEPVRSWGWTLPTASFDVEAAGIGAVGEWLKRLFPRMGEGLRLWGPEEGSGLGIPTFSFEWELCENNGSRPVACCRELRVQKGLLAG